MHSNIFSLFEVVSKTFFLSYVNTNIFKVIIRGIYELGDHGIVLTVFLMACTLVILGIQCDEDWCCVYIIVVRKSRVFP